MTQNCTLSFQAMPISGVNSVSIEQLINMIKCHHLHISKKLLKPNTQWNQMASNLSWKKVKKEKDLGVIIGQNLTLRSHLKVNTANMNFGIIFRTLWYIDQEMFLCLYKSIIRPHLEYATPVWYPLYKKDKIIIENVQRRTTKLESSCISLY